MRDIRSTGINLLYLLLCVASAATLTAAVQAKGPRVLPPGKLPEDTRLAPLKDLNGDFPFQVPATAEDWRKRADRVRRQMLVSQGLYPLPAKTPLNPVIHGKVDRDDYTVERAYFESFPGFYVTGSLYRPKGKSVLLPGVLCPHGHWADGRFHDAGEKAVEEQFKNGGEKYMENGRSPLQARCVQLARMGCVVLHYDMIGYADSTQISFDIAHRFAKQRPEMNTADNWGLFSPRAEAHLQSVMGLQSYNSIRALDFLSSLPDVDPQRIGVTGASGGGTQTFMLVGMDARPAVAMPAVMVSTKMQGGCTCENASCLRIRTGNVEFAGLFAPKPLGMTAAKDWTDEMRTKGFPELQQLYKLLGVPERVMLHERLEYGHNYNLPSREAMYAWFNKYLRLGVDEPIVEREFKRLSTEQMTVWDERHPKPIGGDDFERRLLRHWHEDSQQQLARLVPRDASGLDRFREVYGGAIDTLIGRSLPATGDVEYEQTSKADRGSYLEMPGLLKNGPRDEQLPVSFLHPKNWNQSVVIWIDSAGKAALYQEDGSLRGEVQRLLDGGHSVVGLDLIGQGEFLPDGKPIDKTRGVDNPREAAAYTLGYNDSLFAQRVHDVLTAVAFVRDHDSKPARVSLIGLGEAGAWVAAARAQAGDVVHRAAIDTSGFRFSAVEDLRDPRFLPGGAKYGDLPGMLALGAPGATWIAGEEELPRIVQQTYAAAGAANLVTVFTGPAAERTAAAIDWITRSPEGGTGK